MDIIKLTLPIINRTKIASDTLEVQFGLEGKLFPFTAGQSLRVCVPTFCAEDKRGCVREFSICSSPNNKDVLTIAFRMSNSVCKQVLQSASVGTLVKITGPFGRFTLPTSSKKQMVFLASGIGITPFLSMMRYASETHLNETIVLLYYNRSVSRSCYVDEITDLEKKNSQITACFIDDVFDESLFHKYLNSVWFVCGTPKSVVKMRAMLLQLGVEDRYIKFEEFSGYL